MVPVCFFSELNVGIFRNIKCSEVPKLQLLDLVRIHRHAGAIIRVTIENHKLNFCRLSLRDLAPETRDTVWRNGDGRLDHDVEAVTVQKK